MKSNSLANSILAVVAGFILAGCTQLAVVSEKAPARFQTTAGTNQTVAKEIARAQSLARTQPLVALGAYASAARDSLRELDRNTANIEARRCYNFAVEGIFSVIRQAKLDPWTQPLRVGANKELTLIGRKDPAKPEQNPALYDLVPIAELSYHGAYVNEDVTKDGIGAPLVAVRHLTAEQAAALFAPPAIYYGVTGIVEFEGSRCILSIRGSIGRGNHSRGRSHLSDGGEFHGVPGDGVGQGEAAKTWAYTTPASGGIRLHLSGRPDRSLTIQTKRSCLSSMG